jgi:hypothetical protein
LIHLSFIMPIARRSLAATFISTFSILNLLTIAPAFGWLDKGPWIVGLIAHANLTAGARREIETYSPAA